MAREMKYSGVEWIGEIPKDWEIVKLNRIKDRGSDYAIGDGDHGQIKPEQYIDEGIPYIRVQNLDWGKNIIMKNMVYISEEVNNKNKKSILRPRDILVAKTGATIGKTAIIPDDMQVANTTSSVGKITVDKNYDYRYIFYNISSDICRHQMWIKAMQKSAQPGFNIEDLVEFKIIIPSLFEQKKIADFLDEKIKEIDNAIEKTKESIEEYKKYKQAVITEAVTKGLNSNVEMKEIDSEWIGKIPLEWQQKKLKNIFVFGKGLSITKENLQDKGIDVISYGQIHSKANNGTTINDELIRYVDEHYLETNKGSLVDGGDLIFADTSEDLLGCGNAVYIDVQRKIFAGYHTIILKSIDIRDNKYLAYLFKTDCWRSQIRCRVTGIKLFSITQKILKETSVILPPKEERKKIVQYLDKKCYEIDCIILNKEKLITDLESYKKSLVYEYVTGKKEVE